MSDFIIVGILGVIVYGLLLLLTSYAAYNTSNRYPFRCEVYFSPMTAFVVIKKTSCDRMFVLLTLFCGLEIPRFIFMIVFDDYIEKVTTLNMPVSFDVEQVLRSPRCPMCSIYWRAFSFS